MADQFDVICVGSANLDTIFVVDHVPADDERLVAPPPVRAGGGPAATAAVALARLGVRVAICGVVGEDAAGTAVREMLEAEHVDTRWLRSSSQVATAAAVILVSTSTGGRSIVTTMAPAPSVDEVPIGQSRWLHVDQTGYASVMEAVRRNPDAGTLVSIDAGNPIDGLDLDGVELYAPTRGALRSQFPGLGLEGAVRAAQRAGAQHVVVTDGANGTWVATDEGAEHVRPFPVDIVSTLGAGDVFHGALLAGLVRGQPLHDCVRQANWVAARACTVLDGRSGIPTLVELRQFFADGIA